MEKYETHELCELFDMPGKDDFDSLVSSLKAVGLLEPIKLYEGKILDGCSRYRGCKEAGVKPRFEQVNPDDPIAYVAAMNLSRRHLDASDKAMHGAKIKAAYEKEAAKRQKSGGLVSRDTKGSSAELAAKAVGSSTASVNRASAILDRGSPELVEAVKDHTITVNDAAKIVNATPAKQAAAVAAVKAGDAKTVAEAVAPKKKAPKQGKVVGNFAAVKEALEKITRAADDLNRERSGGKFHREFLNGIEACHVALKGWRTATR